MMETAKTGGDDKGKTFDWGGHHPWWPGNGGGDNGGWHHPWWPGNNGNGDGGWHHPWWPGNGGNGNGGQDGNNGGGGNDGGHGQGYGGDHQSYSHVRESGKEKVKAEEGKMVSLRRRLASALENFAHPGRQAAENQGKPRTNREVDTGIQEHFLWSLRQILHV